MYASSVVTAICDGSVSADRCRSDISAGFGSTSHSSASGSVTLQLASNPADWSNLMTHQEAVSQQGYPIDPMGTQGPGTMATVSIDYRQGVITTGTQRAGYLQINLGAAPIGYFYDGSATMTSGFTIHPFPGAFDQPYTQIQCQANSGNCSPGWLLEQLQPHPNYAGHATDTRCKWASDE